MSEIRGELVEKLVKKQARFCDKMGEHNSKSMENPYGVPQGWALGPKSFIVSQCLSVNKVGFFQPTFSLLVRICNMFKVTETEMIRLKQWFHGKKSLNLSKANDPVWKMERMELDGTQSEGVNQIIGINSAGSLVEDVLTPE